MARRRLLTDTAVGTTAVRTVAGTDGCPNGPARGPGTGRWSRRSSCQAAADTRRDTLADPHPRARATAAAARETRSPRCPPPAPSRPPGRPPGQLHGVLEPIVAAAGFDLEQLDVRAAGRRHCRQDRGGLRPRASAWTTSPGSPGPSPTSWTGTSTCIGGSYTLEVTSPGRRPPADRPAALAAGAPAPGRGAHPGRRHAFTGRVGPAGDGGGHPARRRASCASCATPTSSTPACRWSSGPRPRPSWSC